MSEDNRKNLLLGADDAAEQKTTTDGEALYVQALGEWEKADWQQLAERAGRPFSEEKNRARLALLTAAGLAQQGQLEEMRHQVALAREWDAPKSLIARVLISGAFNSLGKVASLLKDNATATSYFEEAICSVYPNSAANSEGLARNIREKVRLGLLPEAVAVLSETLPQLTAQRKFSSPEAVIFKNQVELLNHMIGIAQRRGQVGQATEVGMVDPKRRATSQLGQELWVLEQTGYKRDGYFVEFGATDGVLLSNTYLLEADYDWTGLCAEPNPVFFEKLRENRHCLTLPDCIGGRTGEEVEFILADEYGGFAQYAHLDGHASRRAAYRESGYVTRLTTISLNDFLKKHGAPRRIDYLSIDTEGSEYDILSAFPFDEWDIRLLTVEHNFTQLREDIRELLESHGYKRTAMQWDDWYVKTET